MAAPDIEPHDPPIKTPRQLIIVVVLAFAVPIALAALLASLATTGMKAGAGSLGSEAVAERIKPVASVNIGEAAGDAKGEKTGEQVMQSTCGACHQTGAAGAPKIGDRAAWAPRIGKGEKSLLESALKGVRAMPPRGGNPDLSDTEVERALVFMANQSGASFKEPAAAQPGPARAAAK
jgi:cytochrome c5